MTGLRYGQFVEKAHKETDSALLNLSKDKKKYNSLELITGLKTMLDPIAACMYNIVPEIHFFANYELKNKKDRLIARAQGYKGNFPTNTAKYAKVSYILKTLVLWYGKESVYNIR